MASLRVVGVSCALVSLAPAAALAQQSPPDSDEIRIEETAPTRGSTPPADPSNGADDTRAREGELVLVITDLPPDLARRAPASGNAARSTPNQAWVFAPDPPDSPALQQQAYGPGLVLGANVGVGGPSGILGAFAEIAPVRAIAARVGAGIGLNFGPSIETGVIVRPWRFWRLAPLVSLTYSTNFTPDSWQRMTGLTAPSNAHWITPGIGLELRLRPIIMIRLNFGVPILLNTGEFSNVAANGWWGPSRPPNTVGFSPLSAADAHDEGRALVFPAVWLDVAALGPRW
ncbi:MAG: hypothetical protein JNK05_40965 [Myxococcales bacterium]|nr:hypothetical protein [Myxococcales bacterium]